MIPRIIVITHPLPPRWHRKMHPPMPSDPHSRHLLPPSRVAPEALAKASTFHRAIVDEVEKAIAESPLVVVGMSQNPHVKKVRQALTAAGFEFKYLEYGSYLAKWKQRLAIKLWSGWPTFPQVYVRGVLMGGEDLTTAAIASGDLKRRLEAQ
jgi:monothiol glutaredoxin